ncbi:MAG: DUF3185 domain-containing protein [Gemmatimonadota bacterium]
MKAATIMGLLLIALGGVGFVFGGLPLGSEETTLGVGPLEVTAESDKTFALSPLVSGIALVAGIGLVFAGARSRKS